MPNKTTEIIWLQLMVFSLFACANQSTESNMPAHSDARLERHRPQFHFTPPEKWMNDPNGMVYYEGEYHLFYQYYPEDIVWGPMHWGHAVSTNLVTWQHLPVALYPDSLGYIFSGSAVIDWQNSSGLGVDGRPPMIAIFTHHDPEGEKAGTDTFQYQSIAYSNDKGRTWVKYGGNPVIPNPGIRDFRDPKVIRDEQNAQWVMVLAADDHLKFYTSQNLIAWSLASEFGRKYGAHGGVWECPDLFPMQVAGTSATKWVILKSLNPGAPNGGSGTQYFVGDFDGKTFTLDPGFASDVADGNAVWVDYGADNYAGVTWSDIPKADGRRLFMGWMSNWNYAQMVPTASWRSAMTLPRTLILKNTTEGLRLASEPVKELEVLRGNGRKLTEEFRKKIAYLSADSGLIEMHLVCADLLESHFWIEFSNGTDRVRVGYEDDTRQFFIDRSNGGASGFHDGFAVDHRAPRIATSDTLNMRIFVDHASIELFADDGLSTITDIVFPDHPYTQVRWLKQKGNVVITNGTIWELKPTS